MHIGRGLVPRRKHRLDLVAVPGHAIPRIPHVVEVRAIHVVVAADDPQTITIHLRSEPLTRGPGCMLRDPFPGHAVGRTPHVVMRRRLGVTLLLRCVCAGRLSAHQPELVLEHRDRRRFAFTVRRLREHLGPLRAIGRAPDIRAAAQLPQGFSIHHQLAIAPNTEGRLVEHLRPRHTVFGIPDTAFHGPQGVPINDHLAVAVVGRGIVDLGPRHAIFGSPEVPRQDVALIVAVAQPELALIHHPLGRIAWAEGGRGR